MTDEPFHPVLAINPIDFTALGQEIQIAIDRRDAGQWKKFF